MGLNMQQVGEPEIFSTRNTVGATESFANGHFTATLTNNAAIALTSVAIGTVSQTTDGYTLQCLDNTGAVMGIKKISIPGKILLETVTL